MSAKTQAQQNFDMMVRNMDDYPVSERQVLGIAKDNFDRSFVFVDAVPDTCDRVFLLIDLLKEKGVKNFENKIWIKPKRIAYVSHIRERLKDYPVNILQGDTMPDIPLIPITNPAVSKRNPEGKGRVTIYPEITKIADKFRMDSDLPGCCNLIEGWWLGQEKEFREWLLPQVYKMVFTPGHLYDVRERLWAFFYKPGYNGPIHVINEEQGYEYHYDFASRGVIIDAGSAEFNDLLFDTQTRKKYIYSQGKQPSATQIKKHNGLNKTVDYISGLKLRDEDRSLIQFGEYTISKASSDILDTTKEIHFDKWKLIKQYQGEDSSANIFGDNPHDWKRHKLVLVPPYICIPNGYAYLHFDTEVEAKKHYSHIMGDLVNFQNDVSRRGKSISEHQTYFLSHLDEVSLTEEQKKTLEKYSGQFARETIRPSR
jgi:hypothetical protein